MTLTPIEDAAADQSDQAARRWPETFQVPGFPPGFHSQLCDPRSPHAMPSVIRIEAQRVQAAVDAGEMPGHRRQPRKRPSDAR